MKLTAYLADPAISRTKFAKRAGISPSFLWRLCKGDRVPSMKMAARIQEATDGAVTLQDWLPMRGKDEAA